MKDTLILAIESSCDEQYVHIWHIQSVQLRKQENLLFTDFWNQSFCLWS